jgi:uncharacterized protein (TIGR04255 family)
MPKRTGVKRLRNSPLVHVLAQVVFTPVLDIADRLIAIQSGFKDLGFARLQRTEFQSFTLIPGQAPQLQAKTRWDFLDREKENGVSLTDEFVVLQTSRYTTFEPFVEKLNRLLAVLAKINIAFVERAGLRYVDLIKPEPHEAFGRYLAPGLLGFPFADAGVRASPKAFRTESTADTQVGTLAVRCYSLMPGQFLPPDLMPGILTYRPELSQGEAGAALDFDHISTRTLNFSGGEVEDLMYKLHDPVKKAFRHSATDFAWERWGPEEDV